MTGFERFEEGLKGEANINARSRWARCSTTAQTVCGQESQSSEDGSDRENDVRHIYEPSKTDRFLYIDQFMRCEELLTSDRLVSLAEENSPIVLMAVGAFEPIRRCHLNLMRRAYEHYAWQGRRVVKGLFVPDNDR